MNGFPTGTVTGISPVRLTTVDTTEWLVLQDQRFVNSHVSDGQKEPFALTHKGSVLTTGTRLA